MEKTTLFEKLKEYLNGIVSYIVDIIKLFYTPKTETPVIDEPIEEQPPIVVIPPIVIVEPPVIVIPEPVEEEPVVIVVPEPEKAIEVVIPPVVETPKPVEPEVEIPVVVVPPVIEVKPPVVVIPEPAKPVEQEKPITEVQTPAIETPLLKDLVTYPLGAAIKGIILEKGRTKYRETAFKYFNSVTCENEMKMSLQKSEGKFDFTEADEIINMFVEKGVRIHGHCLVWRNCPEWMQNFQGDKADWEKLLKNHVQTVVKHFKGRVKSWDVLNEAWIKGGAIEDNIWFKNIGADYLKKVFIWAHEADPDCKLFYNDFDLQYTNKKTQAVLDFIAECKKEGVPIHGIGNQMHTDINLDLGEYQRNMKRFVATGLLYHVSELEVKVGTATMTPAKEAAKTKKFAEIFDIYESAVPAKQKWGITTWGIDTNSWFENAIAKKVIDEPLLFGRELEETPAYKNLVAVRIAKLVA